MFQKFDIFVILVIFYLISVNPEETNTFVTQQLFSQNTLQSFQVVFDVQQPDVVTNDVFGPLMVVMPVIQPLMQISSIVTLLSSFVHLPQLLIDLINVIGSGELMSIVFELI